jgi:hypothetical protein
VPTTFVNNVGRFPKQDKQDAIDLDYENSVYGLDVHCPQCGATIKPAQGANSKDLPNTKR